jgi:hypothetical protein
MPEPKFPEFALPLNALTYEPRGIPYADILVILGMIFFLLIAIGGFARRRGYRLLTPAALVGYTVVIALWVGIAPWGSDRAEALIRAFVFWLAGAVLAVGVLYWTRE